MDAYPFCVFKRADRPCFLVKFKDEAGNYLPPVSTNEDKSISLARNNVVIKTGTKLLWWVFSKCKIDKDSTRGHIMFSDPECSQ